MISFPVEAVSARNTDEQNQNQWRQTAICDKERFMCKEHRCANQKIRFWDLFLLYITWMMLVVNSGKLSLPSNMSQVAKFTSLPLIASRRNVSASEMVLVSKPPAGASARIFFLKAISVSKASKILSRSAGTYKHRAQIMV
jgi:hypothetical protein